MIAVAGGKGGTGKTTTACGLAAALAARRRRPLIVDADADMPDLAAVAGVPAAPGVAALAGGAPLGEAVHPPDRWPGVGVVLARPGAPVREALPALPRDRHVVLDCPGGAGPDAATPLRAADRTVVVTTPTREAAADAVKTAAMADALGTPVAAVLVSRAGAVPAGLRERVGADDAVAVPPAADDPLADSGVRAAHARLASVVDRASDRGKG